MDEFAKILDCAKRKKFTDFFDPMRITKYKNTFKNMGILSYDFGGYDTAERRILGFDIDIIPPIVSIYCTYNKKFNTNPSHRDYLGSILGLGIERGKIGDICIISDGAVIFVHKDMADYICMNLQKVGNTPIKTSINEKDIIIDKELETRQINISSMRLDAIIGAAFKLSRGIAQELIDAEKVFVNWQIGKKSQLLKEGDNITLRGKGRIKIGEIIGKTKKDRLRVEIFQ